MAKTILFQVAANLVDGDAVHEVVAGSGTNSYTVTDIASPGTIKVQGLASGDNLNIMMRDHAGTAYDPWGATLNTRKTTATPVEIGVFGVMGKIKGDPDDARGIIIYVEDAS